MRMMTHDRKICRYICRFFWQYRHACCAGYSNMIQQRLTLTYVHRIDKCTRLYFLPCRHGCVLAKLSKNHLKPMVTCDRNMNRYMT